MPSFFLKVTEPILFALHRPPLTAAGERFRLPCDAPSSTSMRASMLRSCPRGPLLIKRASSARQHNNSEGAWRTLKSRSIRNGNCGRRRTIPPSGDARNRRHASTTWRGPESREAVRTGGAAVGRRCIAKLEHAKWPGIVMITRKALQDARTGLN